MKLRLVLVSCLLPWFGLVGAEFQEDFASPPAPPTWKQFGDPAAFQWDQEREALRVTWDSYKPNSYCYHRLPTILMRQDSFTLSFDLQLQSVAAGVTAERDYTFQLAVGFFRIADATNSNFRRGTARHSPNLVEFTYFPGTEWVEPTVSPVIVSSNGQFYPAFTYPLEMTTNDLFQISLTYSNETLKTAMLRNGQVFGPVEDVRLDERFTDFMVDAISISSYSHGGDPLGSILAHGTIDNLRVTFPDPPLGEITLANSNGVWRIRCSTIPGWKYLLEGSVDLNQWQLIGGPLDGTGSIETFEDNFAGPKRYYRVKAYR